MLTTTPLDLANLLQLFALAFIALYVWFRMIAAWRLEELREKLFTVRDELFDYAAAGHISFDDAAYRILREHTNGLIRYSHELTLTRLLVHSMARRLDTEAELPFMAVILDIAMGGVLDPKVRLALESFHARALSSAVRYVVTGSPVLTLCTGAVLAGHARAVLAISSLAELRGLFQEAARITLGIFRIETSKIERLAICTNP